MDDEGQQGDQERMRAAIQTPTTVYEAGPGLLLLLPHKTRNKEKQRKQPLSSNPKIETIQMCCFLFILLLLQYSIFYTGKSERDWKRSISAHPLNMSSIGMHKSKSKQLDDVYR